MQTVLAATRILAIRFLDFCLGTQLAPSRSAASDQHLHWDRVVRVWR